MNVELSAATEVEASAVGPAPPAQKLPKSARPTASLRAVSSVSLLTLVQLLLQFGTQLLMARYFGTAGEVDAFMAAVALPLVIAAMVSGSLGYVLVPLVAEALARQSAADAAAIARQVGLGVAGFSLLLSILVLGLAAPLIALLCPGFAAEQQALTAGQLRVLSVLILANCLTAYLNALYHSYGQFTRPAAAGVAGTLVTLVYVWQLHERQGIYSVAFGVVAGSAVTIAILLPLFAAQFAATPLRLGLHPGTRRAIGLLTPLVLGAVVWRLDPIVDRFLGSFLDSGSIAQIGYSSRLASGLMLIGTSGLSIVAFPAIAAHAAAGRRQEFVAEIAHAFRFFLFLMIPIAIGASVFAVPVVRLLFEHGKFTPADTAAVAWLLVLSVGFILGSCIGDLLSRPCYAEQDMRTPVLVSIAAFIAAVALKFVLAGPLGASGIVAATSIYSLLNVALLGWIVLRRLSSSILAGTGSAFLRAVIGSLVACLAAAAVFFAPLPASVVPAAVTGVVTYALTMWLLGDEFALRFGRWLRARTTAQ